MKVFKRWHDNVLAGKVHPYKIAIVLFAVAILYGTLMYGYILLSTTLFEIIGAGTLAYLLVLHGVTIIKDGLGRSQEDARVWS